MKEEKNDLVKFLARIQIN